LPHYWETGSAFCEKHPRVEQALLSWHEEATKVEWTTPQDSNDPPAEPVAFDGWPLKGACSPSVKGFHIDRRWPG